MLKEAYRKIIDSRHHDPFSVLGMHPVKPKNKPAAVVIRAYHPHTKSITLLSREAQPRAWQMVLIDPSGFYELEIPGITEVFPYQLKIEYVDGNTATIIDPYSFLPVITPFDQHLFNEGNHFRIYDKMGAHPIQVNGISGVHFAVWAPNAQRVSVVGEFNQWDGRIHQMRVLGSSGIWEIFIPDIPENIPYKYEIRGQQGTVFLKSDPLAFSAELRPKNRLHDCRYQSL